VSVKEWMRILSRGLAVLTQLFVILHVMSEILFSDYPFFITLPACVWYFMSFKLSYEFDTEK
jgi:hypothetical protein